MTRYISAVQKRNAAVLLRKPGRLASQYAKAQEYKDNVDRIEVERFFSLEKGSNGGALITAKLEETALHSIALAVFVTNLFMKKSIRKATKRYFYVLFFSDGVLQPNEDQFIIIEEGA